MLRVLRRLLMLVTLAGLLGAQAHVWADFGHAMPRLGQTLHGSHRNCGDVPPSPACEICISGAWALAPSPPGLSFPITSSPLEIERARVMGKDRLVDLISSRAPPLA